jgi:hypothetical protein
MDQSKNIFGTDGTNCLTIKSHFDSMKLEAVMAYDYGAIDAIKLSLILDEIASLEQKLSSVATEINKRREDTEKILIDANVIEE